MRSPTLDAGRDGPDDGAASGDGGENGAGAGGADGGALSACATPASDAGAVVAVTGLPNVEVTTLAGGARAGLLDGPVATASFANPVSVVVAPTGALLVCDFGNDALRRIDLSGATPVVSTLTRPGALQRPYGMAFGADGALYVDTDYDPAGTKNSQSGTIWRVDVETGTAMTVAADLGRPRAVGALADGRLVLGDYQNQRVRLLDPMTAAVSDLVADTCGQSPDGGATVPPFALPYGVVVTADGRVIVADETNHWLRTVTLAGGVSNFAGTDVGSVDGPRLTSRFDHPTALAVDAAGDIFVSDAIGHRIRRVATDGTVTTVAGDGTAGFADGAGAAAEFYGQEGIAVTPDGLTIYVADGTGGDDTMAYNRVRKITITP